MMFGLPICQSSPTCQCIEPQARAHYYRARDRSRRPPFPVSFWHSRKDREKIASHAACAPCKDYQVANFAANRIDRLGNRATLALLLRKASIYRFCGWREQPIGNHVAIPVGLHYELAHPKRQPHSSNAQEWNRLSPRHQCLRRCWVSLYLHADGSVLPQRRLHEGLCLR